MAAEQNRLCHGWKFIAANAKGGPDRILRQLRFLIGHGLRIKGRTPGNTETELKQGCIVNQAFHAELLGKPQIA